MSNADFWDKKKGYAVAPTVCEYSKLESYHPQPDFEKGKYVVSIKQIDETDSFRLDLHPPSGWGETALSHTSKLKFFPGDESYEYLVATPTMNLVANDHVLKSWRIDFENDTEGNLIFIDTLTWVKADAEPMERKTSWRWKDN